MSKPDFLWFLVIGLLGAVGTAPQSQFTPKPLLEFVAWIGLALFGLLGLIGVIL